MAHSLRKSWVLYLFLVPEGFSLPSLTICNLNLLLSLLLCTCILKLIRKLIVTSSLLIVLTDREESHWVLATLPFIRGLWPHPNQWEWRNVGITYKQLEGLGYPHSSLSYWTKSISVPPPYRRILSSYRLSWHNLWFIGNTYHHLVRWFWHYRNLDYVKYQSCSTWWNVSSQHLTFMSIPETGNSTGSTISHSVQGSLKGQWSSPRVHMCHRYFCSTLASMLPKFK